MMFDYNFRLAIDTWATLSFFRTLQVPFKASVSRETPMLIHPICDWICEN